MVKQCTETGLQQFAHQLAQVLHGGETIELIGDVGAGKTTFTRALARGLGITSSIQSPTFTVSNRYLTPHGLTLAHYDFYRLDNAGIMRDELAESVNDAQSIVVIEWGDIIADVLPEERLTIRLQPTSETERELSIEAHGEKNSLLLEEIA